MLLCPKHSERVDGAISSKAATVGVAFADGATAFPETRRPTKYLRYRDRDGGALINPPLAPQRMLEG